MAKTSLADHYPSAMDTLGNLLDPDITDQLERLNVIHDIVESAWERNINRVKGKPIRYLLVAEAAPWAANGNKPLYFYESLEGAWVGRILRTFFVNNRPDSDEEVWSELANIGFLLVDTLPFALKYKTTVRQGSGYLDLLKASNEHFIGKLNHSGLTWDENVKIALAFKWNGLRAMEAYGRKIELANGRKIMLEESLIAADRSGYTSTKRLREIWGVPIPTLDP